MKRRMHVALVILTAVAGVALLGCSKPKTPEATAQSPQPSSSVAGPVAASPKAEDPAAGGYACTLLTAEEIAAVQSEPFKAARPSTGPGAGLSVSQCYFELPLAVNSVVLTVTRKSDATGARDPKDHWREIFHEEHRAEKDEKEAENKPQEIEGVGDEAFWTGTRIGGALYVLKGNVYFRISVGGAGDQAEKIRRSKVLAENVLKRL